MRLRTPVVRSIAGQFNRHDPPNQTYRFSQVQAVQFKFPVAYDMAVQSKIQARLAVDQTYPSLQMQPPIAAEAVIFTLAVLLQIGEQLRVS